MKRTIILNLLLLLSLSLSAWGDDSWSKIEYRTEVFRPQPIQHEGRTFYSFNDPEIQRLLGLCTSQLQWSTSGQTLYVFTPGRESFWSNEADTVRVNGQEMTAPGRLVTREEDSMMEPVALMYALSLRPFEGEEGGFELLPMVTDIELQAPTPGRREHLLLRSSSPTRPKVEQLENGEMLLKMGKMAWGGSDRQMWRGDTHITVEGGNGPDEELVLALRFSNNWRGRIDNSSLLNDVKVAIEPSFPVAEYSAAVAVTQLENQSDGSMVVGLDTPVRYFWNYDENSRYLTLEIPHVSGAPEVEVQAVLQDQRFEILESDKYPVMRISGIVPEAQSFEFQEVAGEGHAFALRLIPDDGQTVEASGSAALAGYVMARGTIVIDPGHGGSDPGCLNRSLGVREADVTLAISKHLAQVLRDQGWRVVLTRETDRDVTYAGSPDKMELMARSDVANEINADMFVSIHCNASYSSHHAGTSIHWYKAEDYQLAESLEHVLGHSIGLGQKGLIRNRFVVLRYAEMPSVLVETAYLTNPYEGSRLANPQFQKVIAQQLAGGLANYVQGRYAQGRMRPTE